MPIKIEDQAFLQVERILPPPSIEEFYVDIEDKNEINAVKSSSGIMRTNLPMIPKLFEWRLLKEGDELYIRNQEKEKSLATVIDERYVNYKGQKMIYNQWGQEVTGWSSICIYEWAVKSDCEKTLDSLRRERLQEMENDN